ncbi:hypothetical protein Gotri_020248, partial [Gossypium trilobum]|nr:hypothetical protein [Gossypium trilobum]
MEGLRPKAPVTGDAKIDEIRPAMINPVIAKALRTEAAATAQPIKMVKAIRVHQFGGPQVLKWEDVELGEPREGEIRIKNKAIGLNFIDIYFRKGVYKAATMPFTPGW